MRSRTAFLPNFVPIRPGTYEYYIENQREDGMLGTFVVT